MRVMGTELSTRSLSILAYAVQKSSTVRSLTITGSGIGDAGCESVGKLLQHTQSLTSVDLSDNGIGEEGALKLARGLVLNDRIQSMYLAFNRIGPRGIYTLSKAFARMTQLTDIELSHNPLGDEGVEAFYSAMRAAPHGTRLKALHVNDCNIRHEGALLLADLMRELDSFSKLYITDNDIDDEGARALMALAETPGKEVFMLSAVSTPHMEPVDAALPAPEGLTEKQRSKLDEPDLEELLYDTLMLSIR